MANGRYNTPWNDELGCSADNGRYATIGSYTPDMEITTSCRNLLMSRLNAAELLNSQLTTDPTEHLHTVHPPSSKCSIDLAIEQLRAQLVVLIGMDIEVIRQLLTASEQMEEIKWQRKFGVGGSSCTPSSYLSESCTIDTDGNELDPLVDYSMSKYATMSSVSTYRGSQDDPTDRYGHLRYHRQYNGHFGHDVTGHVDDGYLDDAADDVFQTEDDGAPQDGPTKPDVTCQSRDVPIGSAQNGVKVKYPDHDKDKVKSTKVEFRIQGADDKTKQSKLEFKVNNSKEAQDDAKQVRPGVTTNSASDIKAKVKTSKVEFKVDHPKEGSLLKKLTSSQVEIRFMLQPKETKSGRPEDSGHRNQPVDMPSRRTEEERSSELPSDKQDTKYSRPALPVRKMMQAGPEREATKPISTTTTTAQLLQQPKTGHAQAGEKYATTTTTTTTKNASLPVTSEKRTERKEIVVVHL